MAKSRDLKSELLNGQASRRYNKTGTHLLYNNCRVTSSEEILPIFQKLHLQHDKRNV